MSICEILAHLTGCGVFPTVPDACPISVGASGAKLYALQCGGRRYVLKWAHPSFRPGEPDWILSYRREAAFYRVCAVMPDPPDFVPEVCFCGEHPDHGILLVLAYHEPIPHWAWDDALLTGAMDVCARLHSMDPASVSALGLTASPVRMDAAEAEKAHAAWRKVLAQHPGRFDEGLLAEIFRHLDRVCSLLSGGSARLCHGDFHPENLLREGSRLFVCDWQNVHLGQGVGDIAFFCSRGSAFGIPLAEERLIDAYCGRLSVYTGTTVRPEELLRQKQASALLNVCLGWPYHLLDCPADWVGLRLSEMTDSYRGLFA